MLLRSICCLLCLAPALAGAEVNRSWDVLLQSIQVGKKVVVTRMTSAKAEGKLLGITADSITVERGGKPQVIQREDVFRVRYADIRMTHTLLGMVIGFGGGAILGAASGKGSCNCAGIAAAGVGLIGMGMGAAAGGALPIGKPLYEAQKPVRAYAGP